MSKINSLADFMKFHESEYRKLDKAFIKMLRKNSKLLLTNNFWDKTFDFGASLYIGAIGLYFLISYTLNIYQNASLRIKMQMDKFAYLIVFGLIVFSILIAMVSYIWILPFIRKFLSFKIDLPIKRHSPQFFIIFYIIVPFIIFFCVWHYSLDRLYEYNTNLYLEVEGYNLMSYIIPLYTLSVAVVTYINSRHSNLSIIVSAPGAMQRINYTNIPISTNLVLNIWCNNNGGRKETFKFVGVVSWQQIKEIKKERRVNGNYTSLGTIINVNYTWQTLAPGEKGNDNIILLDINDKNIIEQFIYVLYMDSEKYPYFYPIYLVEKNINN